MSTVEFLRSRRFSENIIRRFFKPFFAGVCLDPEIKASSRVFQYIFRIFAEREVALPGQGMAAIADQLMDDLPPDRIRTESRVESVHQTGVVCGEYGSVPGIQWAMLSGRLAAEQILKTLE